ncbi:MAG TPA: hypothetical protein DEA08_28720 [Planctomycetes bacterium]|nr:hypothetical protein [Planctomycetota bacterium]|tara:strand:+ start:15 stop:1283 length:1269 start_codon:yes stop_codon:yes gene_type:complete
MARVLIADDDPSILRLLELALGQKGHEVVRCEDGAEALVAMGEGPIDLVLSDVQMPNMDGIALTRALRQDHPRAQLPIVLLSALSSEDDVLRGLEAGANDYLAKPCPLGVLQAKVGFHLAGRLPASEQKTQPDPGQAVVPQDGAILAGYRLGERLGAGAVGEVFRATRLRDGRSVALKVLHANVNEDRDLLSRYFRELAIVSNLELPHVVRFLDSGFSGGRYFMAMELVEGRSAGERLKDGALPLYMTLRLGAEVCQAIAGLADKGLVHRDIKPPNVVIDASGSSTLVDFGLVIRQDGEHLTGTNEVVGTPSYIAPEVILGSEDAGPASDLYALGITVFECLSAQRPYRGSDLRDTLQRIVRAREAPDLARLRPDLPQGIRALVASLTVPKLSKRLTDPRAAEEAFRHLLDAQDEPTTKIPV